PAPEGPRVSLGARQAGAVLGGRRRGVSGPPGGRGRRPAHARARRRADRAGTGSRHQGEAGGGGSLATTAVSAMNRELIMVIEQLGREKGIDKEVLFEALESALLSASRKSLGPGDNVRIHIDRKTGEFRVYHRKKVVEEVGDPETEISLTDAKALNPEAELEVELGLLQEKALQDLGRIAAQTAKQVILQNGSDAERDGIWAEFIGKLGQS